MFISIIHPSNIRPAFLTALTDKEDSSHVTLKKKYMHLYIACEKIKQTKEKWRDRNLKCRRSILCADYWCTNFVFHVLRLYLHNEIFPLGTVKIFCTTPIKSRQCTWCRHGHHPVQSSCLVQWCTSTTISTVTEILTVGLVL